MKKLLIASLLGSVAMTGSAMAQMAPTTPATDGAAQTETMGTTAPAAGQEGAVIVGETNDTEMGADAGMMGEGGFLTYQQGSQMLGSNLMSADVWGADGESIGNVDDLVLDNNGEVIAIVVGVGGFLGIGEKDVAITTDELEFVMAQDAAATGAMDSTVAPTADTAAGTMGTTAPATGTTATAPAAGTMGTTATAPAADGTMGTAPMATADAGRGWGWNGEGIEYIQVAYTRDQLEDAPEFEYID